MLNILYFLLFSFMIWGDYTYKDRPSENGGKILFVVSNADHYGTSDISTSNHFAEIVYPYDELTKAGYHVDFVSPEGGAVPLGYIDCSDKTLKEYLYDCHFMGLLKQTAAPESIDADKYVAIYYGGGGAAMFGVADNKDLQKIAQHIYENNSGVISAVCHGSIGIANLKLSNGEYLVSGKKINGFPDDFENKEAQYFLTFDNSVEGLLRKRGAIFNYSKEGWDSFYQVDGRLITGQDPTSARKVAQLIIETLEIKK